ncbi:bifunctional methylenetetrahydrofolate dehydrogenase/methenyltetrahydrofolate cyclohydrolase FolD [Candidatus Sumerlaeota bacterium]|nr:bifunctional methylenetetrahydrofolate dehydrogenase/methenyltetrahydrofolate cyclohydrolase FolD [Candidatus Sumerlaeota bacterium]
MAETTIIDGKAIAAEIHTEIVAAVEGLKAAGKRAPGLAVVLIGDNPASKAYVSTKTKRCAEAGFHSVQVNRPGSTTRDELLQIIHDLNEDPSIHGILVQLPLPPHIDEQEIIAAISPDKDVDGFHPINAGKLSIGLPGFVPCTPLGIQELLLRHKVQTSGAFAVVLGRSNLVGRPAAQLLSQKGPAGDATVCIAHSRTRNLADLCRRADILVAAIGRPNFVTGDMIKPGAVVIDVGINRIDDASSKSGSRIVGDVDFEAAKKIAGAITPVPGGVGPMTVAMLLRNTLQSARRHQGL